MPPRYHPYFRASLVDIWRDASTEKTINQLAEEATEEAGRVGKNIKGAAAGGTGKDLLRASGSRGLRAGAARVAVVGGKLLPAAGLGASILTSYKHGENESLPETVCRIEKCDPTIKVVPDKRRSLETAFRNA